MKIYYNKKQRNFNIGLVVVMALALMAVLDRGNFDPRTSGFWSCILQAFFTYLFFGPISFKKTVNNPDLLTGKEN
ncbi:hypothetical protein [Dyadobacter frigoris]|uniref:Uncharacterized protein n=1 Tax=Dyadobacter frigoris TaxID=2576211 RepID=A0A4U6D8T7_9BACT|nr:hypothetical protein [Dyadobacter frigoris]TKT93912.1 hypothetical protein FDK13_01495 [Dyadobacter frigoris]